MQKPKSSMVSPTAKVHDGSRDSGVATGPLRQLAAIQAIDLAPKHHDPVDLLFPGSDDESTTASVSSLPPDHELTVTMMSIERHCQKSPIY